MLIETGMDSDKTFEDSAATMLNCGWQIAEIARHFNVTSEQVVLAIRLHTRQEREEEKRDGRRGSDRTAL